jgi:hypothetical protein
MIYGHGAQEADTAVERLRREFGLGAYNAACQGDGLYQEYLVARRLLPELHPRTLVVTVFLNDFLDLETDRSAEEIAAPPELAPDVSALTARLQHPEPSTTWSQLHRLKLWRSFGAAKRTLRAWAAAIASGPVAPTDSLRPIVDDSEWVPLARYYDLVIADLTRRAREAGADLVLLDLDIGDQPIPGALPAQDRIRALLDSIGTQQSIRVLGTRALFEGCGACFLPHDGHLTREGHRRLAAFVAGALAEGRAPGR